MPTTLFSGLQPTRIIHVGLGTGSGDGSKNNPYHSIQAAVNAATPGTAIVVHAGTYTENVKIPWSRSGSDAAPIWLVSGDGAQKASIVAADKTKPVIQALGVDNYIISDFKLSGGYDGIQFSQSGRDFSNLVNNVLIQNNVITGVAHDGIKVGQANNIQILDNRIDKIAGEEGIDFVAVSNGLIARNEVSNVLGSSAAIFAKGGSTKILIEDNYVHDVKGDGISAGGNTDSGSFRPGYVGYEAKNIDVVGNRVENVGKRPVSVRGAIDVDVANNFLESSSKYGTAIYVTEGSQNSAKPIASRDVRLTGNTLAETKTAVQVDSGAGSNISQSGFRTGTWIDKVGPQEVNAYSWLAKSGSIPAVSSPVQNSTSTGGTPSQPVTSPVKIEPSAAQPSAPSSALGQDGATAVNKISGTSGQDKLVGTSGADRIDGLSREDVMAGGKGDDTYVASGYKDIIVERADEGIDTVEITDSRYFLSENVENLVAKSFSGTTLVGNDLSNKIIGNAGNDILIGYEGRDLLTGGAGADTFVVDKDGGSDTIADLGREDRLLLSGGQFANFASLKAAFTQVGADAVLDLGDGQILTLKNVAVSSLTPEQFAYDNLSAVVRGSAAPTITISGGTKQSDQLIGSNGHDLIDGVAGGDVLSGGKGDDTYHVRDAHDVILETSAGGTDTAVVHVEHYALDSGVENARVALANGVALEGNAGANWLIGGDGDDLLSGGGGADLITGGKGADTFLFTGVGEGADTITDFVRGTDTLDFQALFDADPSGKLSFQSGSSGLQIYFDHAGQHELISLLTGISVLSSSDYIV